MAEPNTPTFSFFSYALLAIAGSHSCFLSVDAGGIVFIVPGKMSAVFWGTGPYIFIGNDSEKNTQYAPSL